MVFTHSISPDGGKKKMVSSLLLGIKRGTVRGKTMSIVKEERPLKFVLSSKGPLLHRRQNGK